MSFAISFKPPRLLAVFAVAFVFVAPLSLVFAPDARAQITEDIYQRAIKFYEQKNYTKAASLYRKAAEKGEARAQNDLGLMYQEGKGVRKNNKKAAEWWRKAAEQGEARAQFNLGWMYKEGKGVLEDYQKAVEWYRKAAEQGEPNALNNLSVMYIKGHGVKKDMPAAYALLLLAVKEGNETARNRANKMKKKLTTEQVMARQKIAREWEQRIETNKQKNR